MYLLYTIMMILFFPVVTFADSLPGRVVRVVDGDTIVVQDINKAQHIIRMTGIDAPELNQAYGEKSKENLSESVTGRFVVIEYNQRDRYRPIVGKVFLGGQDMNLTQIIAGLAWHDKTAVKDLAESDRELYRLSETEAHNARRGLWFDDNPVPPWSFRKTGSSRNGKTK